MKGMKSTGAYWLAFGIGAVAGLRSMMAPALVSAAAHRKTLRLHQPALRLLGTGRAVKITRSLAISELAADKMPKTPARTDVGPLLARIVSGALCGAAIADSTHKSIRAGAALGGLGAVAGAFGGYQLRMRATEKLGAPLAVAVAEDAAAIGGGWAIVSNT